MPAVNSSSQSETVFGAQQLAVIRQYLSSVDTGSVSALQGDGSEGVRFLEAVRELCSEDVVVLRKSTLEDLYDFVNGKDVPHPGTPEYVELHQGIQAILHQVRRAAAGQEVSRG